MAEYLHGFCTLHRCAYNRELDPTCPQCSLQGIPPSKQLDYDSSRQMPLDDAGKFVSPRTLKPVD